MEEVPDFVTLLVLFYPSVTGIMAGSNRYVEINMCSRDHVGFNPFTGPAYLEIHPNPFPAELCVCIAPHRCCCVVVYSQSLWCAIAGGHLTTTLLYIGIIFSFGSLIAAEV